MNKIIILVVMSICSMTLFANSQTLYFTFDGKHNKLVIPDKLMDKFKEDGDQYLECLAATSSVDEDHIGEVDEDWKKDKPNVGAVAYFSIFPIDSYISFKSRVKTSDTRISESKFVVDNISNVMNDNELWKSGWGSGPALVMMGQKYYDLFEADNDKDFKEITIQKEYPNINNMVDKGFACYIYESL